MPVLTRPAPDVEAAGRAAALAARRANAARLRSNFMDAGYWQDLAGAAGVKLPPWGVPVTTAAVKQWLDRLGLTPGQLAEWRWGTRHGGINEFVAEWNQLTPNWPLKALVGLLLEELERRGRIQHGEKGA